MKRGVITVSDGPKTDSNEVNDLFGANITRAQFNKIFAPFFNVPSNSAGFFYCYDYGYHQFLVRLFTLNNK